MTYGNHLMSPTFIPIKSQLQCDLLVKTIDEKYKLIITITNQHVGVC